MKTHIILFSLFLISKSVYSQSVEEIFRTSQNTYENASTYLDSGKVFQEIYGIEISYETAKYFKTAYSKKGMFSFEYYEAGKSNSLYTITCDSSLITRSWWGVTNKIATEEKLEVALSNARGVSSITSTIIAELIYPNKNILGENIFKSLKNTQLLGIENIHGLPCFKIEGEESDKSKTVIYISTTNFLIFRIVTDKKISNFSVKSTYDFYSEIPKKIDNTYFIFRPNRKVKI